MPPVAEALGKSANDPITAEEMGKLERFGVRNRGIRELTGLQFATNLTWLDIQENRISDISPVAPLIKLQVLWLDDNDVSDILPVKGLTALVELGFNRNRVSNLAPVAGLTKLEELHFKSNDISEISPAARLTNLENLYFSNNNISDLSPISRLTRLKALDFDGNNVSSLSPIAGFVNLEHLGIGHNNLSDLSPIAGLINLKFLYFPVNNISDMSPLKRLVNLEHITFHDNRITDLSPLAGLVNLRSIHTWGNRFSDISSLRHLRKLEVLDVCGAQLSDLSPLAGLTSLKEIYFFRNEIPDISPLAGLTGLTRLRLEDNDISDISPLAGLTNLKWLAVQNNKIVDFSPLDGLRENVVIVWHGNPGFPKGGPKIAGPWLWVILPDVRLESGTDLLSEVTGGSVTEVKIATDGATEGMPVGDDVWTSHKLPPTGRNNLDDMLGRALPDGVIYGTLSLHSPRDQETTMYVGGESGVRVWLNGSLIHENLRRFRNDDYSNFFPVTLRQGDNALLVAVVTRFRSGNNNAFLGFEPETEYTVANPGVGYAFSDTPIHFGDTFTLDIRAENVFDLAGWQFDIAFDPARLEAKEVSEGDFLKTDGGATFFQSGRIDNAAGKITGLIAGRISEGGVSGTGSVLQVRFKAKTEGETKLALENFLFGSVAEASIPAGPREVHITVEERLLPGDVNRDGVVNILDLIRVAQQLGQRVSPDSPVDVNGDGVVNIFDLTLVAQGIGGAAAPPARGIGSSTIETWIAEARLADDGSIAFRQGIANLQSLLASLIVPEETALHANYPNPFNPETWIPYNLSSDSDVQISIYDAKGALVRHLDLRHQPAGFYTVRGRAAYWDGCNENGEAVASGVYFYQFRAEDYSQMRRMVVVK